MQTIKEQTHLLKTLDVRLGLALVFVGMMGVFTSFHLSRILVESSNGFSFELGRLFSADEGVRYRFNGSIIWQDIPKARSENIAAGDAVFTSVDATADIALNQGANFQVQPNSLIVFKRGFSTKDHRATQNPVISVQNGSIKVTAPEKGSDALLVEIKGKTYSIPAQTENHARNQKITIEVPKNDQEAPTFKLESAGTGESQSKTEAFVLAPAPEYKVEEPISEKPMSEVQSTSLSLLDTKVPNLAPPSLPTETITNPPPLDNAAVPSLSKKNVKKTAIHSVEKEKPSLPLLANDRIIGSEPPSETFTEPTLSLPANPSENNHFSIGLGAEYFAINATDQVTGGQAKIVSGISPKLSLGWNTSFTPNDILGVSGSFTHYDLQAIVSNDTLANASGTKAELNLTYTHQFNSRFTLGLNTQMHELLFLRSETTSVVSADKIVIFGEGLSSSYEFYRAGKQSMGLNGHLTYLAPASNSYFNVKSGSEFGAGLYLMHHHSKEDRQFTLSLDYSLDAQNTSLVNENEQRVSLQLTYHFGLAW